MRNDEGKLVFPDTCLLRCEWSDNAMMTLRPAHLRLHDKTTYEGEFSNGERNGNGILRLKNGTDHLGLWVDDRRSGYGYMTLGE